MKKIALLLATVILTTGALIGCGSDKFKDGTYTGESAGLKGPIKVEAKIDGGKLSEIEILENKETETIFESIKEYLIPDMIEKGTADVDTVSGATTSSKAVIEAVQSALESAK